MLKWRSAGIAWFGGGKAGTAISQGSELNGGNVDAATVQVIEYLLSIHREREVRPNAKGGDHPASTRLSAGSTST
jgi:hypothetical protein